MKKTITEKDVVYALRYGGQQLCMWPGKTAAWSLEPSGKRVGQSVANAVCAFNRLVGAGYTKHGEARYILGEK